MTTLQTLDRGLRALDAVSQCPAGITVADLARRRSSSRA
ncbi:MULTISPECIES: helix-turn-helix domain-containing protein [Actinomadura]|uniref:Helix-turn-helix domain-containing protein n=1 Tax=Actinomadura yumaensis TaxID=111807 RepID=A0ABW2CJQ4_9ACTN